MGQLGEVEMIVNPLTAHNLAKPQAEHTARLDDMTVQEQETIREDIQVLHSGSASCGER